MVGHDCTLMSVYTKNRDLPTYLEPPSGHYGLPIQLSAGHYNSSYIHVISLHHFQLDSHVVRATNSRSPQAPEKSDVARLCLRSFFARAVSDSPRTALTCISFRLSLPACVLAVGSSRRGCVHGRTSIRSVTAGERSLDYVQPLHLIKPLHLTRIVTYLPIRAAQKPVKSAPNCAYMYLSPAPNGHQRTVHTCIPQVSLPGKEPRTYCTRYSMYSTCIASAKSISPGRVQRC